MPAVSLPMPPDTKVDETERMLKRKKIIYKHFISASITKEYNLMTTSLGIFLNKEADFIFDV